MYSLHTAPFPVTPVIQRPLVFVDVETTGFDAARDRIVELGLVGVDGDEVSEWTTLLDPERRWRRDVPAFADLSRDALADAPRFRDVAEELRARLAGRVFVAHNARFDFRFLAAEFARLGIRFETPAICTLALARRLQPTAEAHHLDALLAAHGLTTGTRHRALPDARALWCWWQRLVRDTPAAIVEAGLAHYGGAPPERPALCADLPAGRGVYAVFDAARTPLAIRSARRLRSEASTLVAALDARGASVPHTVEARRAAGPLDAALVRLAWARELDAATRVAEDGVFLRVTPDSAGPLVERLPVAAGWPQGERCFAVYASRKRADRALGRLARDHGLCRSALGLAARRAPCPACASKACTSHPAARLRTLAKLVQATSALRLPAWPYAGAIAVREHGVVHVFADWCHLGTARDEDELAVLARTRAAKVDVAVFELLATRLGRARVRPLGKGGGKKE